MTTCLTTLIATLLLSACGVESDRSGAAATLKGDRGGAILKLYETPHAEPNPACDLHTRLVLAPGVAGTVAHLEAALVGFCEIAVDPMPRSYELKEIDPDCGSRRYRGEGIEVIDHRTRTCKDRVPAPIIVHEGDVTYFAAW